MVIVLLHCSTFRVVLNVALCSPKGLSFPLSQTTDIYVEKRREPQTYRERERERERSEGRGGASSFGIILPLVACSLAGTLGASTLLWPGSLCSCDPAGCRPIRHGFRWHRCCRAGGKIRSGPQSRQIGYLTPAVSGSPTAAERGAKSEVAHKVGKLATSPLPYRGAPPLQSGGLNQKWPTK